MKSGNLNFLEPSGLLLACNGTDLPYLPSFAMRMLEETKAYAFEQGNYRENLDVF